MSSGAVGTPASSVFVGNLAYDLSEKDVIDYFSQVGPVKSARIVTDKETGKPRGFGFVEFHDIATAESSVRNLNGTELNSRTLKVVFAENNAVDRGGGNDSGIRRLFPNRPVGVQAVMHAGKGMGETLGSPFEPDPDGNKVISLLARKNKNEMYEYLAQVQKYSAEHPVQARELLANNPQLCQAIFIIEILLGLVGNPLGDQAPSLEEVGPIPVPMDPRKAAMPVPAPPPPMTSAPRPMVSMSHAPPTGGPAVVPGMTSEQQQALLQQVMSLTPQQIDLLPPQQKSQVLALQQSLRQN